MISDKHIEEAAAEYEEYFLSSLSAPTIDEHIFSEKFEDEMRKISRRAGRKASVNIWKRVAVIVLISGILFAALSITKTEVRASITNWINWQFAAGSGHIPSDALPTETPDAFQLTWVMPNYLLSEVNDLLNGQSLLYKNTDNCYLVFTYLFVSDDSESYVAEDNTFQKDVAVFGRPAKLYLSTVSAKPSTIVWKSHDNSVLFIISAYCDEQTLIKIAESVRPAE